MPCLKEQSVSSYPANILWGTCSFSPLTFLVSQPSLLFGLREEEPLVHVRLLDNQLSKRYGLPLTDLCMPRSHFAQLSLQLDLPGFYEYISISRSIFSAVPELLRGE